MDEKMRKIILSSFIVILSLSLISCNNSSEKESAESNKLTRKNLKTYFITTNEEENKSSNWVFGESNENPLEEKEDTNERENVVIGNTNENQPAENNTTTSEPQNNNNNTNTNTNNTMTNNITTNNNNNTNNNNYSPDPNYNMNDIIPGPYDENSNPADSNADPNDIVSDPYANEGDDSSDDENGYKEAEDRTFGNEPD